MNCEFVDKNPVTLNKLPKNIVFNNEVHGEIKPLQRGSWHACFHAVPSHSPTYGHVLMQGFGDTPEEAFLNAFEATKADLERDLAELKEFRRMVLGRRSPGE